MASAPLPDRGASLSSLDDDSRDWLEALDDGNPRRDDAVGRLHGLLLRAARQEVLRRRSALARVREDELDDLALQAADDALVALLAKLGDYRGRSRFTTWAYKFALLEASVRVRRRAWRDREVLLEPEGWSLVPARSPAPEAEAEGRELVRAVGAAILRDLTPHQRGVLVAVTLDGVPIDVLAERLGTTRGALYKTLHDARRRLRARLAEQGLGIEPQRGGEGGD